MDHRQHPRFPVRFHSSFCSVNLVAGDGIVVDLSLRGCGMLSPLDIQPGTTLELRLYTPNSEKLLTVEQAVVRWYTSGRAGLEFVSLQPEEWARLQDVLKGITREPSHEYDERTGLHRHK